MSKFNERKPRWGRLAEIAHLQKVPTIPFNMRDKVYAFDLLPTRLKHLASWRRMHKIRNHPAIRKVARRQGVKPSSDITLPNKIQFLHKRKDK
jgi:hypothetical protein